MFLALVETKECYTALINSEMSLFWLEIKVWTLRYHFGIHCRDCMVRPPLILLRQDSDAELKCMWEVRGELSSEVSVFTRTLGTFSAL